MTRRVYIGNSGGQFIFRASQPGVDALTGDISRMATFEGQLPMVPKAQGSLSIAAAPSLAFTSATISTGASFAYPPFLLFKETSGLLCGENSIWALMSADASSITFYSYAPFVTTVKWWAFAEL